MNYTPEIILLLGAFQSVSALILFILTGDDEGKFNMMLTGNIIIMIGLQLLYFKSLI